MLQTYLLGTINNKIIFVSARNVPTGRIVGGRNAVAGEVPYQVSLRTLGNSFYCGGAIVAQAWTLSGKIMSQVKIGTPIRIFLSIDQKSGALR